MHEGWSLWMPALISACNCGGSAVSAQHVISDNVMVTTQVRSVSCPPVLWLALIHAQELSYY